MDVAIVKGVRKVTIQFTDKAVGLVRGQFIRFQKGKEVLPTFSPSDSKAGSVVGMCDDMINGDSPSDVRGVVPKVTSGSLMPAMRSSISGMSFSLHDVIMGDSYSFSLSSIIKVSCFDCCSFVPASDSGSPSVECPSVRFYVSARPYRRWRHRFYCISVRRCFPAYQGRPSY